MSLNNLSKEELLALATELTEKMSKIQDKLNQFDAFYTSNFTDNGEQLSNQTKLTKSIEMLEQNLKKSEEIKNSIQNYNNEIFLDSEGKPALKTQIDNHLVNINQIAIKTQDIQNNLQLFYNENLLDEEGKESRKTQINKLIDDSKLKHNEILNNHKLFLIDEDGRQSIKSQVETAKENIIKASQEILVDEPDKESLKTKMDKLHETILNRDKEHTSLLEALKLFHKSVFENTSDEFGAGSDGLKKTTETLKVRLEKLIQETTEKLHGLTDSSLHNSFFTRAKAHTDEYEKLQTYTFRSVVSIAVVTLVFGLIQMINILCRDHGFSYQITYYQLGITLPLIYVVWMYNRNQKIAKKLAEEYHHKAALSEAMTGYRDLYQLKHESKEYMELFNGIKEQLNINPSTKIDKFLSLKSPQENLINKGADIVNPSKIMDALKDGG